MPCDDLGAVGGCMELGSPVSAALMHVPVSCTRGGPRRSQFRALGAHWKFIGAAKAEAASGPRL